MKKSNKLLLGIFITALLIAVTLHIALYARYKKGDYTTYDQLYKKQFSATYPFGTAKYLSVKEHQNVTIHLSDTGRIEYNKANSKTQFSTSGDTVTVVDSDEERGWDDPITMFVPSKVFVRASNSNITIKDAVEKQPSLFTIDLNNSKLLVGDEGKEDTVAVQDLKIRATNKSEITLNKIRIKNLEVILQAAELNDNGATIINFSVSADAASRLSLSAENFRKAKMKTAVENE